MDRTNIIVEHVRNLIDKYGNDEETQKRFYQKVEKIYFSNGESEDEYISEIAMWRKKMPKITGNYVEVFYDGHNKLILSVTGTYNQSLNDLYTVITSKVIEELYNTPEIIKLNPTKIHSGDGDEGCIYFEFEEEKNEKPQGTFFSK